jgi:phosphoenolpyruvate carboxykinase (ATP)
MPDLIRNTSPAHIIELSLKYESTESSLTSTGALKCLSGAKTGRSPKDKRIVESPASRENVWWGPVNIPLSQQSFMINRERAVDYLRTRDRLFVVDAFAGHDAEYRVKIRVICSRAYHALFMQNMLIPATGQELEDFVPDFVIYNAGCFPANRYVDGMTSSCSIDLNLERGEMIILGTQYAGEMKKGVLTLMMYQMTARGQLCLHSSANEDPHTHETTLFFGLSGTGKTTLSADPARMLIGDDEHVWTERGIFNIEGG